MTELILNEAIHQRVIKDLIPEARQFLWIVTADLKDMHVAKGRRLASFLGTKGFPDIGKSVLHFLVGEDSFLGWHDFAILGDPVTNGGQ